jgi:hypothetical protein
VDAAACGTLLKKVAMLASGGPAMKSNKTSHARRVSIVPVYDDLPLPMRQQSFARFSDWIDGELQKLVARWERPAVRKDLGALDATDRR